MYRISTVVNVTHWLLEKLKLRERAQNVLHSINMYEIVNSKILNTFRASTEFTCFHLISLVNFTLQTVTLQKLLLN